MHILPVKTKEDLERLASLSREIFHEHYDSYMDKDHVDFYLEKFQSVEALKQQLAENHFHYLILQRGKVAGFVSLQLCTTALRLSKLYLKADARNFGLGEDVMDFVEDEAIEHGKNILDLIVNRQNKGAIRFYQRMGFEIREELTHSFENGHTEEDYLMSKTLE